MPRYTITFTRSVVEYHKAEIEADSLDHAQELYDEGGIDTTIVASKIVEERDDEIEEI